MKRFELQKEEKKRIIINFNLLNKHNKTEKKPDGCYFLLPNLGFIASYAQKHHTSRPSSWPRDTVSSLKS
jgi:hypothetical protein